MQIEKILKSHKKSFTKERNDIYEFIKNKHLFSSNELLDNFGSLGRASIFRTINLFLELGIIRKILLGDRGENYELVNENHHHEHMTCEKCHKIIHFESDSICKDIIKEANKTGFKVKSHSINITGTCEKCL